MLNTIRYVTKRINIENYNVIDGNGNQTIIFDVNELGNFTKFNSIVIKDINGTGVFINQFGNERGIINLSYGFNFVQIDNNKQIYLNPYISPNIRLNGNSLRLSLFTPILSVSQGNTNGGFMKYVPTDSYELQLNITLVLEYS